MWNSPIDISIVFNINVHKPLCVYCTVDSVVCCVAFELTSTEKRREKGGERKEKEKSGIIEKKQ